MGRLAFAAQAVVYLAKEYPVRFTAWLVFCDAASAVAAFQLSSELESGRLLIVGGAVVLGFVAALAILFLWGLLTAPRRVLSIRVVQMQEILSGMQGQLSALTEEKFGPPLRWLPVYEELRTLNAENLRKVELAIEAGHLWGWSGSPNYRPWNKVKDEIATNPWAQVDGIHGELQEAFRHADRLATDTSIRVDRNIRDEDQLEDALAAMREADSALDFSISRLSGLQAPVKPEGNALDELRAEDHG